MKNKKLTPILIYIVKLLVGVLLTVFVIQLSNRLFNNPNPYDLYMGEAMLNETADIAYDGGVDTKSLNIQTGRVQYETAEYQKAKEHLLNVLTEQDAVIMSESENIWKDSMSRKYRNNWYQINVPADKLKETLKEIEKSPYLYAVSQSVDLWDVTEIVSDTESRIKAKTQLIQRYQELLENATEISDLIAITDALSTAESELSELKRQQNDTQKDIQYSEISISLTEVDILNVQKEQISYGKQFATAITRGFFDGIYMIGMISLWLLGHWLIIMVGFLLIVLGIHSYKKHRKGRSKRDELL